MSVAFSCPPWVALGWVALDHCALRHPWVGGKPWSPPRGAGGLPPGSRGRHPALAGAAASPRGARCPEPPSSSVSEDSALSTRVPGRERSSCSLWPSGCRQPALLGAGRLFRVKKMIFVPSAAHAPSGSGSRESFAGSAASRQWDLSYRVSGGVPVSVGFTAHQLPSQRNGQFSRNVCLS